MNNEAEHITLSNLPAYAGIIVEGTILKNIQRCSVLEGKIIADESSGTHAFFDFNGERRYCWYEDFAKATGIVSESAKCNTHEGTKKDGKV